MMTMQSRIRQVKGRVDINFFAESFGDEVSVVDTSRGGDALRAFHDQLFQYDLIYPYPIAGIGEAVPGRGYRLLSQRSRIGWWGDKWSDAEGAFPAPQTVSIEYEHSRDISYLKIVGDKVRGEYPVEFSLRFFGENGTELTDSVELDRERDANGTEWRVHVLLNKPVKRAELCVTRWSKPHAVAKISYFCSEQVISFTDRKLKSLEILEEKTGDVDKLSYGISSNYCKISILNEGKRFYREPYYSMLKKNRAVLPFLSCGGVESSLGRFYSEEWQLNDDSMYFTCKAYDILYSLQNLTINYGLASGTSFTLRPYTDQTMLEVIETVFERINAARNANGLLGNDVTAVIRLDDDVKNVVLPYVLIEEKSAWDILNDIANFCCAYIYVDRDGQIVIEQDDFTGAKRAEQSGDLIAIDPSNSFSYNLPINSNIIVNKVKVEYYTLEEEVFEKITKKVKKKEFIIINNNCVRISVPLDKIFPLTAVTVEGGYTVKIIAASYKQIVLELSIPLEMPEEVLVYLAPVNNIPSYKLTKGEYITERDISIQNNGVSEYTCKTGMLMLEGLRYNKEPCPYYKNMAAKILDKYQYGLPYVETEWKGNEKLTLASSFTGKSLYDDKENPPAVFECLSNELKLEKGFRQKTKGRGIL